MEISLESPAGLLRGIAVRRSREKDRMDEGGEERQEKKRESIAGTGRIDELATPSVARDKNNRTKRSAAPR